MNVKRGLKCCVWNRPLALALALVLVLFLAIACGSDEAEKASSSAKRKRIRSSSPVVLKPVTVDRTVRHRQWLLRIERIEMSATDGGGDLWDGEGELPAFEGEVSVGTWAGDCKPFAKPEIKIFKGLVSSTGARLFVTEAQLPSLCLRADFEEDDVWDEKAGEAVVSIHRGRNNVSLRVGAVETGKMVVVVEELNRDKHGTGRPLGVLLSPRRASARKVTVHDGKLGSTRLGGRDWDPPDTIDKEVEFIQNSGDLLRVIGLMECADIVDKYTHGVYGAAIAGFLRTLKDKAASLAGLRIVGVSDVASFVADWFEGGKYDAEKMAEPDPRVAFLWTDGSHIETPFLDNTRSPVWMSSSLLTPALLDQRVTVALQDRDWNTTESMGSQVLEPGTLRTDKKLSLELGGGNKVTVSSESVSLADEPSWSEHTLSARVPWLDTGVEVLGGQTLYILATGQVCLDHRSCVGPDGDAGQKHEFSKLHVSVNNAQLCALIGETITPVGSEGVVHVATGGRLLLGIATSSERKPTGSYRADVGLFFPLR